MKNMNWFKFLGLVLIGVTFAGCSDSFNDIVLGVEETEGREIQIDSGGDAFVETRDGQRLYRDESGEFTSETPLPDPTPTPEEVSEASLIPFALVVLLALMMTACNMSRITIEGDVTTFNNEGGTKANATAQISGYSRGGVQDGKSSEGSKSEDENWTDAIGGGEVSANTAVGDGDASQEVVDDAEELSGEE